MIQFEKAEAEILKRIGRTGGCVLLLDFDGVLSRIVTDPRMAGMSEKTSDLLNACAKKYPTAIISGRTLENLKSRVALPDLMYIGNHGLEWEINGRRFSHELMSAEKDAVISAKQKIEPVLRKYPGILYENKPHVLGMNYRRVPKSQLSAMKKDVASVLDVFVKEHGLRLEHNKKTYELRPADSRNKGDSVELALEHFKTSLVPVYIGDGLTDEDAFKALPEGITIRVRPKKGSEAKYYFKSRKGVDDFLAILSKL